MQINNGTINPRTDVHGNPQFAAMSWHQPEEVVVFHTSSAAVFWLWLIDERVRGEAARRGILRDE